MAKKKTVPKPLHVENDEPIDNEQVKEFAKNLLAVPKKEIDEVAERNKALSEAKRKLKS